MRASARIVATADGPRGTRLAVLYGEPPLLPRRTGPAGGEAQVHLVGGAAGPLGGDVLAIEIEVREGARLCVRGVAASLALPGATGRRSRLTVTARVAAGGRLRWLTEPLIGAAGCDHESHSIMELAEGAALVWREELICGRYGEPAGDVRLATTVRYGGRTLLRNDLAVGPRAPGWDGPSVLGGGRAAGTVVLVDPSWATAGPPQPAVLDRTGAVLPLSGGPGVLVSAVGDDHAAVRRALDAGSDLVRPVDVDAAKGPEDDLRPLARSSISYQPTVHPVNQ
ncbi:urease accessory protein UreD [Solwaraspora sp. WMMD1047]|uniref:urease accessory protein UreD n=1 Tax=Solwaraspora sp. WMMD1047 TaxID=3016102 RepID=UPI002417BFFB|nr:urease accessory protein UreD [Solwaraspora sp. WMMD1047]MDG4830296.1 urease accessory protein UreD [Solwaraspora sp. WMMD1047]